MDIRLEMIHLRLTRQCNLNCWFCGQRKGGLGGGQEETALCTEEWLAVVDSLESEVASVGNAEFRKPSVMLWGGEPLMSPCFDQIASILHKKKYPIGMVTNGTLLDRHMEVVSRCLNKIYISIDGPELLHDSIRGKGTFQRIKENLQSLKQRAPDISIVCMAVLTKELKGQLETFFQELCGIPVDEVLLQDMIWMNGQEIEEYQNMMEREFSQKANAVEAWRGEVGVDSSFSEPVRMYPFQIYYLPHVHSKEIVRPCLSPYRHLHVMWNGETCFCTDFTDFSLGNVRDYALAKLFLGEKADRFRSLVDNGENPTCRHCSWGSKEDFFKL